MNLVTSDPETYASTCMPQSSAPRRPWSFLRSSLSGWVFFLSSKHWPHAVRHSIQGFPNGLPSTAAQALALELRGAQGWGPGNREFSQSHQVILVRQIWKAPFQHLWTSRVWFYRPPERCAGTCRSSGRAQPPMPASHGDLYSRKKNASVLTVSLRGGVPANACASPPPQYLVEFAEEL